MSRSGLAQEAEPGPPEEAPATATVASAEPETDSSPRPNHFVPILDILAFDYLVNRAGHQFVDTGTYDVSLSTIRRNLKSPWVLDNDPFSTNQFLHPYQGATYHGFARSAGLGYWQSMGYTFAGSLLWEIAGETSLPSRNDQITTGIGGSFLGEPLFRLANLVRGRSQRPGFWRELSAAIVSPSTGFNRLAYGQRFRTVYPDHDPAIFGRVQFGAMRTSSVRKDPTQPLARNETVADLSIDYGLPGRADYSYRRPFDYFNFQFTTTTGSRFETISSRGLLVGKDFGEGVSPYRGVWGLYGTYDYVFPQIFRVSSTALALGTTLQRRITESSALQATVLAGVGYGAAGTISGSDRGYHYGLTPQMAAVARYIPGDRAALDLTFRDFYVSRIASTKQGGSEHISRADAQITFRFLGPNAASIRYIWSRRSASVPEPLGDFIQSRGAVGLFYTYLGGTRFGVVD